MTAHREAGWERARAAAEGAVSPETATDRRLARWLAAALLGGGGIALFAALVSVAALGAVGAASLAAAGLAALYAALVMLAPRRRRPALASAAGGDAAGLAAAPETAFRALPEASPRGHGDAARAREDGLSGVEPATGASALEGGGVWLRHFYDHAPLGIAVLDDAGRVLESNTALRAIAGLDEAAAAGVRLADIVGEEDRAELASYLDTARRGAPARRRWRLASPAGSERWPSSISAASMRPRVGRA